MASKELYAQSALHRMVRYDARREILECLGDISDLEIFGNQVLLAPYVPSGLMWSPSLGFPIEERLSLGALNALYDEKKAFLAQQLAVEALYQGKVMLVVKVGDDPKVRLQVGEWVWSLQENTRGVSIAGKGGRKSAVLAAVGADYPVGFPCKISYDTDLYGRIPDPDMVV